MRIDLDHTRGLTAQVRAAGIEGRGVSSGVRLYRFYDAAGVLLYVGVTSNFPGRWQEHKRKANWWSAASHVEVTDRYPHMNAALDAELEAIRTEGPSFNRRSVIDQGAISE